MSTKRQLISNIKQIIDSCIDGDYFDVSIAVDRAKEFHPKYRDDVADYFRVLHSGAAESVERFVDSIIDDPYKDTSQG